MEARALAVTGRKRGLAAGSVHVCTGTLPVQEVWTENRRGGRRKSSNGAAVRLRDGAAEQFMIHEAVMKLHHSGAGKGMRRRAGIERGGGD